MKKASFFVSFILVTVSFSFGEMSFFSVYRQYLRALAVSGERVPESINYHSLSNDARSLLNLPFPQGQKYDGDGYYVFPSEVWSSFNSFAPSGGNDGPLWQGKGLNAQITGGFGYYTNNIAITLLPSLWFAQNLEFDIIETTYSSGYGDYWTAFDNLQRYGNNAYYAFSPGESDVRYRSDTLTVGISTESIIIGPGQFNNIILSNNAGGFPHIDVGTNGHVSVASFGDIEVKYLWGALKESEFFDEDSDNDYGFLSGLYVAFSPSFVPNLSLGFNHQYYKPMASLDGFDLVRGIPFVYKNNSSSDSKDAMLSATFSWLLPNSGFEFYGEWARNDYIPSLEDFFRAPEHSQAVTFGINQVLNKWNDNILLMTAEITTLERSRTLLIRAAGPWYRHAWAGWAQGYTHNGQLLGAEIGPGSNSQVLRFGLYAPDSTWGVEVQRIAHDLDYYYALLTSDESKEAYSELRITLDRSILIEKVALYIATRYSYFLNHNYIRNNNNANLSLEIGLQYHW